MQNPEVVTLESGAHTLGHQIYNSVARPPNFTAPFKTLTEAAQSDLVVKRI